MTKRRRPRTGVLLPALALGAALVPLGAEYAYRLGLRLLADPPPAGSFEIYALGGSTTVGDPYPSQLAFPALTAAEFGGAIGGRQIVVRNLARVGDSSYPQSLALERALLGRDRSNPGVVLVYNGNNEAFAPADRLPALCAVLRFLRERVFARSLLARDAVMRVEKALALRGTRDLAHFEHCQRRIVETAMASGLIPVLATDISNVGDFEPNVFAGAAPAALAEGLALQRKRRWREAIARYGSGIGSSGAYRGLLHYQIGRCHEALGERVAARESYWTAVDVSDEQAPGRATRPQNEALRRLARECGAPLVDSAALFEAASPRGITGRTLFADWVHPNMDGHVILANAFAEKIAGLFGARVERRFKDARDVFAWGAFGPADQARTLAFSGIRLLSSAGGHPWPERRLEMAEYDLRLAAALTPDDYRVWLGLGRVAEARARGGVLPLGGAADLVDALWSARCPTDAEIRAALARLKAFGAPADVLAHVARDGLGPARARYCGEARSWSASGGI